ncbi:MAG: DinB family protein [Pyrinomonadaceae bacterium]
MSEVARIIDQLERAYRADAWCGSSLLEALASVNAAQASAHPLPKAHSIWEVVTHVSGWKKVVQKRLEGEPMRLPSEGDWPEVSDTSEAAWRDALAILEDRHRELVAVVRESDDSRSEDILFSEATRESGGGVSCYITLHGAAQHDLYHAGQISLLKKY